MPSTSPPSRAKRSTRLHHRREARDRADAQVVAVGEAAGDDDGVDALQVARRRARGAPPRRPARAASSASTLVAGAGEADDAELHDALDDLVVLDQRVGEQPLAHLAAAAPGPRRRARSAGRRGRCATPSKPSAGSARSTAWPCGSRIPAFGRMRTRALTAPCAPARPRTARRRAARRPRRSARACARRRRRGSPAPAASCPSRCRTPSRARTACRTTAGRGPARTRRPARSARSPACSTSSPSVSTPSASRPNSNFVSARMTPRARACSATPRRPRSRRRAAARPARAVADELGRRARSRSPRRGPTSAFVDGREDRLGQLLGLAQARAAARCPRPRRSPGSPSSPSR